MTSGGQALAPFAEAQGLFAEQCLTVETPTVGGSQNAISAAVGGGTDLLNSDALNAVRSIGQGLDLEILAFPTVVPIFDLIVSTEVKTPKDIEGLRLGVTGLSNSPYYQLLQALESLDVDPEKVDFIDLGDFPSIYAGMIAGELDGGIAAIPFGERLLQTGDYYEIIDLGSLSAAEYPSSLASTTGTYLKENREIVVRLMTAYVKAIALFKEDPETAKEFLAGFLALDDKEEVDITQKRFAKILQSEPLPVADQLAQVIAHLEATETITVDRNVLTAAVNTDLMEEAIERANK